MANTELEHFTGLCCHQCSARLGAVEYGTVDVVKNIYRVPR